MKKSIGVLSVLSLSFVLAACEPKPQQAFLESHKKLEEAKTVTTNSTVTFDIDEARVKVPQEQLKESLVKVEKVKINVNGSSDKESKQHELEIGGEFPIPVGESNNQSFKISVPVFLKEKEDKVYVKAESVDSYLKTLSAVYPILASQNPSEFPAELKGKVVEIDLKEKAGVAQNDELENKINNLITTKLRTLPEENFQKQGDSVIATIPSTFVDEIIKVSIEESAKSRKDIPKNQLETITKEQVQNIKKFITFNDVKIDATIVKGQLVGEKISIPVEIKVEDKFFVPVTIQVDSEYTNVNEKVDFTFNLNKDNVVTLEQFSNIFSK